MVYIDSIPYSELKEMGISNTDLYNNGITKDFFYDGYGNNKVLNKLHRRFHYIYCEIVNLHYFDNVKYYGRNGKVYQSSYVKMNFSYYNDYNEEIKLKHLKDKRIFITISDLKSDHFYPKEKLDYNMIKRKIKLKKIINKING